MITLGLESSCDETAAAVLENGDRLLSSVVASQVSTHRDFGGVVPELASREHIDNICQVVAQALARAGLTFQSLDAIAVTQGPGLVGALLVGLTYAKGLAFSLGIPYVGVNHLQGHIASVLLENPVAEFPALALVVSGGHTSLYYMTSPTQAEQLAQTLDDAAGEALDKLAKLLGLGYPGGPVIDRLSEFGNALAVSFSLPRIKSGKIAFSFSGLKSAAVRYVGQQGIPPVQRGAAHDPKQVPSQILDLLASYQKSIVDQLIDRLDQGLSGRQVGSIQLSGGVSCNSELRRRVQKHFEEKGIRVYYPSPELTTDNAAMIAAAGVLRLRTGQKDDWDLQADPNLALYPFLSTSAPG